MRWTSLPRPAGCWLFVAALGCSVPSAGGPNVEPPAADPQVDPRVEELLDAVSKKLQSLNQFRFRASGCCRRPLRLDRAGQARRRTPGRTTS